MAATTEDRLLGGRLRFTQPAEGYRAAIDPVLLAATVPARPHETVLEAGTGAGAAALCLLARLPDVRLTGIEIDPALAGLARTNAAANGFADRMEVIEADVIALRKGRFDHAMVNPPFQAHGSGTLSPDRRKVGADRESGPGSLGAWIDALSRRLAPRGSLSLILPAARISECLAALRQRGVAEIAVKPVAARDGAPAIRILVQGRKAGRGPDRLLPPLVLHQAGGGFTAQAEAVLRHGHPLPL